MPMPKPIFDALRDVVFGVMLIAIMGTLFCECISMVVAKMGSVVLALFFLQVATRDHKTVIEQ